MKKILEVIKSFFKKENTKVFISFYVMILVIFLLEALPQGLTLPMMGDFTSQTYTFYLQGYNNFWHFIKTGEIITFDFSNYIGANYIGTQSFYYLFSPLFYLLCLWPKRFIYQGIFFHMILKYTIGAFIFYRLLKKYFNLSLQTSWIGGLIYALSGWSLYYIWFHYSDIVAIFPLMLIGIEKILKERKGLILTISLFLIGITNYFFAVNFYLFGFFYAMFRWIDIYRKKEYKKVRWNVLLQSFLYYLAGVLLACFVLIPSFSVAMQSNRSESTYLLDLLSFFFKEPTNDGHKYVLGEFKSFKELISKENTVGLFKYLFVWKTRYVGSVKVPGSQQIGYILSGWLYMNTNCWNSTMFDTYSTLDNSIGGLFIYTPITMLLIPTAVKTFKSKDPWKIFGLIACIIIPMIPITYYLAFGFTQMYGRWEIWIVICALLYLLPTLDKLELVNRKLFTFSIIFNYALAGLLYYFVYSGDNHPEIDYIIVSIIELLVMLLVYIFYRSKKIKVEDCKKWMYLFVVIEIAASFVVTIEHKGLYGWKDYYYNQPTYREMQKVIDYIKDNDDSFYRIYNSEATKTYVNLPSNLSYNGISTFNSTYNFESTDYIRRSRSWYNGGWTMGYHEKRYFEDEYLGIKYYIVDKYDLNNDNRDMTEDYTEYFDGRDLSNNKQEYKLNIPFGYKLYKSFKYYDVYINENYINLGYTVDNIISSTSAGTSKISSNYDEFMMDAAILKNEDFYIYNEYENLNSVTSVKNNYTTISQDSFDVYFALRTNYTDDQYTETLLENPISKDEMETLLPSYSQFFHGRLNDKQVKGDMFILKLKEGSQLICPDASNDNFGYINLQLKMGPRMLVSLYHGDKLITQDAHHVPSAGPSKDSYEWKTERGFYVNEPIDKIVIEFIYDAGFDKVFSNIGVKSISLNYMYQNDIENKINKVKQNSFIDVNRINNQTFTFKTNVDDSKIAVTNIPYDPGWKLIDTDTNEEINTMNVNGGFVGFEATKGLHSYKLKYYTSFLKEGIIISVVGLFIVIVISFIYKNKKIDILEKETTKANEYFEYYNSRKEKETWLTKVIYKLQEKLKCFLSHKSHKN